MIAFLDTRAGRVLQWLVGAALLVVVALAIGRIVPTRPDLGIVAALMVLAVGITAAEPAVIPLIAMPMLLWGGRIGAGANLSVSDAVLFVATLVSLALAPRPFSPPLRTLLWLSALYQFATLFTVLADPYASNVIEWFHAWMLVSGALIVGWHVGRSGHAVQGLTAFMIAVSVLALGVVVQGFVQYAQGDFYPVYPTWPFEMHKNFAGTVLALGAVVAYARPHWMSWSRRWSLAAFWVIAVATLFTQSRQALLSLGLAVLFIAFRTGRFEKRSKLIVVAVVPLLVLVGTLVKDQIDEGSQFNSVFQRLNWYEDTIAFWNESPWVGHGLRYWYQPSSRLGFQPPNAELEVLASAGVIGLAGFLALMVGAGLIFWRLEPTVGTIAFALLLTRLIQSQLDLFWVAVQVPSVFAIAGVALGVAALGQEHDRLASLEERPRTRQAV